MKGISSVFTVLCLWCLHLPLAAQQKPVPVKDSIFKTAIDTPPVNPVKVKWVPSPRKAAVRSAILPGWGQAYNKHYWKIPVVYTALGITGYIFIDNMKTYREYRFAYSARYKASLPRATAADSADYYSLKEIYKLIQPESIRSARDRFRQYIDYSVLFFIFFWGLNVAEATVDAHLQGFDVSPDLSLKIKAGYSPMANTSGVSLVLSIGKNNTKKPDRVSLIPLSLPAPALK